MKRSLNTAHWLSTVDTGQRVFGRKGHAWRRGLERHLGIERGGLRAAIDRPMDDIALCDLDDKLAAFLRHHADLAYARCQRLDAHLCRLVETRNNRETARILALPAGDGDFEWSWLAIGTDIEQPMRQQFPEIFEKEAA